MTSEKLIRINNNDIKRIRNEVQNEFLHHNPKFKGMMLANAFLINKMINFYLGID